MEPFITYRGGRLQAVPAIHYNSVFALHVNAICSSEQNRPDAIAVELGAEIVRELVSWMRELGTGNKKKFTLPCMTGILTENSLVHPCYKDAALYLQEHYLKPIQEVPSDIKNHLLHFSERSLVAMSSTDSIIEAIRCSVELNIPVFGVDLDEFAMTKDESTLLGDPMLNESGLERFITDFKGSTAEIREPYIDGRREKVMAAKLKFLLENFKRVLFTCGLAHWEHIVKLMADDSLRPSDFIASQEIRKTPTRAILHPLLALRFMDRFPVITPLFEKCRQNPASPRSKPGLIPPPYELYRQILEDSYNRYLSLPEFDEPLIVKERVTSLKPDFERLLEGMRLISQQSAPSINELFEVSQSLMPAKFSRQLANAIMDIGHPWASQKDFPGLPVIMPPGNENQEGNGLAEQDKFSLVNLKDDENYPGDENRDYFYLDHKGRNRDVGRFPASFWQWEQGTKMKHRSSSGYRWVWPPCEALLYGTAFQASRIAVAEREISEPAIFDGSLYDGPDIRASIRSVTRGESRIYIKKPVRRKTIPLPNDKRPEPTVFIFGESEEGSGCNWNVWNAGSTVGDHVKKRSLFAEVTRNQGSLFVASISLDKVQPLPPQLSSHVSSMTLMTGIITFGNPCINSKQAAQWLDDNDFSCCPVLSDFTVGSINALIRHYKSKHKMEIVKSDWRSALVQFAIPYARERVVVIAPETFKLSRELLSAAKRRKISISLLPLNYFPAARIFEMRKRFTVRSCDQDGRTFDPAVESAIGQKVTSYRDTLPLYMQQQLQ